MQELILSATTDRTRSSTDELLRAQLDYIAARGMAGNRGRGWAYELGSTINTESLVNNPKLTHLGRWRYTTTIRFYRRVDVDGERFKRQSADILEWAAATGHSTRFSARPWIVTAVGQETGLADGPEAETELVTDTDTDTDTDEAYIPMREVGSIVKGKFFDHLYGLDSQITVLLSALQAASDSDMANRFHTLLFGEPGCGKTEILQSTSRLLTKLGVSHQLLDATSTTEAGMRKMLLDEDAVLPEVFLIEEIEKTPENSLRWLLGIMDIRGTIQQTNYRKSASRRVPAIVLATANDIDLLKRMMYGALHSRFQHEVYCPRPDKSVLRMILEREIAKVNGDVAWIEPTLAFMCDERLVTDPRKIIPVCLCGKESLLDGTYQNHLRKTMGNVQGQLTGNPESQSLPAKSTVPNIASIIDRLKG